MILRNKNILISHLLALALLGLAAPMALAQATARACPSTRGQQLLQAALRAERETSYTATQQVKVFMKGDVNQVRARVRHLAPEKTRTEFLSPENMAGTILIQDGDGTYRYSKKSQAWFPTHSGRPEDHTELLLRNYNIRFKGDEVIDGRKASIVQISPKHPGNPSKTLWLDRATSITLRSVLRNSQGEVIGTTELSDFDPTPSGLSAGLFEAKPVRGHMEREHHAPGKPILPGYLPAGYVQTGISGVEFKGFRAIHLKFSDGLNTISLFEKSGGPRGGREEIERHRFSRVQRWSDSGWEFMLVADLSSEEMQKIANSLKPGN